jgi:hypothetical protein
MPSRPISQDTTVDLEDQLYIPAIDLTLSPTSAQNVKVAGTWFTAGLDNPIVMSFSGVPDAAVTITYVVTRNIKVPANPAWYAFCGINPTADADFTASVYVGGVLTLTGTVTIASDGAVTYPLDWDETELTPGDAVTISSPATPDATMSDIGIGFKAVRY